MSTTKTEALLSAKETIVLQELMNIAFGSASADLEEVLSIYVELNVPQIDVVPIGSLTDYFNESSSADSPCCIVEQQFWGDFGGAAYMILPKASGSVLLSSLDGYDEERLSILPTDALEQGAILEVGNILTGACIGKIAELMNTVVTYTPPQVRAGEYLAGDLASLEKKSEVAIILKTCFRFTHEGVDGYIFVATREESLAWVKQAIGKYVGLLE